ncbi:MAG TPA: hypothetical protein VGM24_10585, partial [Puia sp.]
LDTVFDENHMEKMKFAENFIKISIERLFRVNGSSAQETGVIPDILLRDFTDTRSERERTMPFALANTQIEPNKYYHPYPALPLDSLKAFARAFSDTCTYLRSFNHYLDQLLEMQVPKNEPLSLEKVRQGQERMNSFLAEREKSANAVSLPYEIQWNAFEKIRMRTDEDLRNTNQQLTNVLLKDPGLLLGYQLASRMLQK